MASTRKLYLSVAAAALLAVAPAQSRAQGAVAIDADDVGGVVSGPNGPEAGVWVIAETTDMPTKFAKIVVTDDQGRYLVPDLPKAKYSVWVRGYGLVDSPKVETEPGKSLESDGGAGAQRSGRGAILSGDLLVLDDQDPATKASSAATAPFPRRSRRAVGHQHQEPRLRRLPSARPAGDPHDPRGIRRVQLRGRRGSGACSRARSAPLMVESAGGRARRRAVQVFRRLDRPRRQGRSAAGEAARGRKGVERNLVITTWEWGGPKTYLHDQMPRPTSAIRR